jgi:hypothetical protein
MSILIPLQPAFFPSGFTPYRLKKICGLLDSVSEVVGRLNEPNSNTEGWKFEISGEKLSDFLEGCYRRLHQNKNIHTQKCEEYEAQIKLLE